MHCLVRSAGCLAKPASSWSFINGIMKSYSFPRPLQPGLLNTVKTMRVAAGNRYAGMLLPSALFLFGCQSPVVPLDLSATTPAYEQSKTSAYHAHEGTFFRLKAQELHRRSLVYGELFGPDSDWVQGARLLARFYEQSA